MIYYINAYSTLISAALGVFFSIMAVMGEKGKSRTNSNIKILLNNLFLYSVLIRIASLKLAM